MSVLPVYVIFGTDPEGEGRKAIGIELEKDAADAALLNGLVGTIMNHLGILTAGGQMSVLVTRGREPTDAEANPPGTFASFSIVNAGDKPDRHAWEFSVERKLASTPLGRVLGEGREG